MSVGFDGLVTELLNRHEEIRNSVTESQVRKIWRTTGKLIAQELLVGKAVTVPHLGTFQVREEVVDGQSRKSPALQASVAFIDKHRLHDAQSRVAEHSTLSAAPTVLLNIQGIAYSVRSNPRTVASVLQNLIEIGGQLGSEGKALRTEMPSLGVLTIGGRTVKFQFSRALVRQMDDAAASRTARRSLVSTAASIDSSNVSDRRSRRRRHDRRSMTTTPSEMSLATSYHSTRITSKSIPGLDLALSGQQERFNQRERSMSRSASATPDMSIAQNKLRSAYAQQIAHKQRVEEENMIRDQAIANVQRRIIEDRRQQELEKEKERLNRMVDCSRYNKLQADSALQELKQSRRNPELLKTSIDPQGTDIALKYKSLYLEKPELRSVLEYQVQAHKDEEQQRRREMKRFYREQHEKLADQMQQEKFIRTYEKRRLQLERSNDLAKQIQVRDMTEPKLSRLVDNGQLLRDRATTADKENARQSKDMFTALEAQIEANRERQQQQKRNDAKKSKMQLFDKCVCTVFFFYGTL
jgi:hypothetical protein